MSKLIDNQDVIDWIKGEGVFIEYFAKSRLKNGKEYQKKEFEWGNEMIKSKDNSQWTTKLGEKIVKEVLEKNGKTVKRPKKIQNFKPDWETEDAIYEVKSRSWTTTGTAGEKILGCPFKYADIPELYGKKLQIILVAYQEYEAKNNFHLFETESKNKNKMIEFWKELNIEFVCLSDLIN